MNRIWSLIIFKSQAYFMKLNQKHYLYYIVFNITSISSRSAKAKPVETSAIEIELRQKITSIAHCEEISTYIQNSHFEKEKKKPTILVTNFILLKTQTRWFQKG